MSPMSKVLKMMALMVLICNATASSHVGCRCFCPNEKCTCLCGTLDKNELRQNIALKEEAESTKSAEPLLKSFETKLANRTASHELDEPKGGYNEKCEPVVAIENTNLFTGLAYRLHYAYFGKAPIIASEVSDDLEVKTTAGWHKPPYRIIAERRQTEWPKYTDGGVSELNALFIFIKKGKKILLVNLAATSRYPRSYVNDWKLSFMKTGSQRINSHKHNCGMTLGCAYIDSVEPHSWRLKKAGNESIYVMKGKNLYLGFKDGTEVSDMGIVNNPSKSRIVPELAGTQLSGTIVNFKTEGNENPNFHEVNIIQTHDIINNSSRNLTQTFAVTKSITNSFTFEFSKTLREFSSVTVKAGIAIEGVFSLESETTTEREINVAENQQWTTITSHNFSIHQTITILPFRRVTVEGVIQMAENVEKPFVAQILVSMSVISLTSFSRAAVVEKVPRWMLRERLEKHVQGKYIQDTADGILFEISGTMRGSFGVSTMLHVKEFPVLT